MFIAPNSILHSGFVIGGQGQVPIRGATFPFAKRGVRGLGSGDGEEGGGGEVVCYVRGISAQKERAEGKEREGVVVCIYTYWGDGWFRGPNMRPSCPL